MGANVRNTPHTHRWWLSWPPLLTRIVLLAVYCAISQTSGQRAISNNQINQRTLTANQQMAMALLTNVKSDSELMPYNCAQHCNCSLVKTFDSSKGALVNLTRASCTSPLFSDVLTIDRRTQIIHISLPLDRDLPPAAEQQPTGSRENSPNGTTEQPANRQILNSKRKQQIELMTKLLNINVTEDQQQRQQPGPIETITTGGGGGERKQQQQFRMPRLVQFTLLREIAIVNLRIEMCDSEIFKRNQRLHKLKWNFNQLKQVSKSCFRHLDKLRELNLDHNRLGELESALFSPLVNLRHLSLAHNRLSELTAHQFANLTRLQSLNLVGNSFRVINLNLFEPMAGTLQLLILAKNQIRQFVVVPPANVTSSLSATSPAQAMPPPPPPPPVMFRNLIKLNVDFNKLERVKLLQLHRFFNVKFLSMRGNQIVSIRDRAFNGLKLVELNLAQNRLASIWRCAFCNSTIKRLNLAENNITSLPMQLNAGGSPLFPTAGVALDPNQANPSALQLVAAPGVSPEVGPNQQALVLNPPASSASMLVLSQSILGPLFGHLEYLDLSENRQLANQLEILLEPLLELQYLNLAATGLDRVLPTPTLFKNLRRLRYLNLSMNHLDQIVPETVEPLIELELLDLSQNDFSELDESFLAVMDELPMLKFVNFASNPWYCSQCKISALYEWMSRSPIYNATCLALAQAQAQVAATSSPVDQPAGLEIAQADLQDDETSPVGQEDEEEEEEVVKPLVAFNDNDDHDDHDDHDANLDFIYRQQTTPQTDNEGTLARAPHHYSVLDSGQRPHPAASVDFDLILDLFEGDAGSTAGLLMGALEQSLANATPPSSSKLPNYQLVASGGASDNSQALVSQFHDRKRQLSRRLLRSLAGPEDDRSVGRTIASLLAAGQLAGGQLEPEAGELLLKSYFGQANLCLECEFPSELRSLNLHELAPADFKYCAGSAPRFAASEPKIGLTLAIVIIGALFVVIIVVIVIYRKKSNAYYPGEDLAERLEAGQQQQQQQQQQQTGAMKKPVLSISSEVDNQYGDNTDYSSPPMSQSYSGEESYTEQSESQDPDGGEEDEDGEDEDPDEDDEDEYEDNEDEDDQQEGEGEEEDFEDGDEEENFSENEGHQPQDAGEGHSSEAGTGADHRGGGRPPARYPDSHHHHNNHYQHHQDSRGHSDSTHPKARFEEEQTRTEAAKAGGSPPTRQQQQQQPQKSTSASRQFSHELSNSTRRVRATTSGGGASNLITPSPHAPSSSSSSLLAPAPAPAPATITNGNSSLQSHKVASLDTSQGSQSGNKSNNRVGYNQGSVQVAKQMTHNDRDDSTPIYIGPRSRDTAGVSNVLSPNSSLDRAAASDAATPASLSADDLLASAVAATTPGSYVGGTDTPEASSQDYKGGHKMVQLNSLADRSLNESYSRAMMTRTQRARENNANANEENSHNTASWLSRSDSRPPEPQTIAAATTTPKTILHHHIEHRHSSESHSNAGPVSFAPTPAKNSNRRNPGADGVRRDRLKRASQTICVDQVKSGADNVRGPARRTRHQMSTLATSSGHERFQELTNTNTTRTPISNRQNIFASQASNGRTLVDIGQTGPTGTVDIRAPPPPPPPPVMVATTAARHEDALHLNKFARGDPVKFTCNSGAAPPPSSSPTIHNSIANDHTNNQFLTSDKTAKPARQVAALRGRPLIKQPRPQLMATLPKQENQQFQQQMISFHDDDDDDDHYGGQDSFNAEAQLANLPSDLDETDLDQMLSDGPASNATGGRGGGALELDSEQDEFPDEQTPVYLAHHNSSNLHNSHSTHSALTQTGSRDFESY